MKSYIRRVKNPHQIVIPVVTAFFLEVLRYCQSRPDAWVAFFVSSTVAVYGKVFHSHTWAQTVGKFFISFVIGTVIGKECFLFLKPC